MKLAMSEATALATGSAIRQFAVVECLGMDLHTALYRAECTDTEHPVLLMEYLPAGLAERRQGRVEALAGETRLYETAKTRFAARLREVAQIGHPAIPILDDCWQEEGTLVGVGPWQSGRNLSEVLDLPGPPLDADTLRRWIRTLGDALATLHEHHTLHGNLSFHMFRLRKTGQLMLPLVGGELFDAEMPPCIAPEQHPLNSKPAPLGPWTDVYQLSAVVYQWLTGAAPPTVLERWEGAPLEPLGDQALLQAWPQLGVATRKGLSMHHDGRPASVAAWLELAGLADRRSRRRRSPDNVSDESDLSSADGPRDTMPGGEGGLTSIVRATTPVRLETLRWTSEPSPRDPFDEIEDVSEDTPVWVWVCLGIAVIAFLSILARTL